MFLTQREYIEDPEDENDNDPIAAGENYRKITDQS